jgi:threonine synthase
LRYVSTRGEAPELGFEEVLLTGLARDGGLYVPAAWPTLQAGEYRALAGMPYEDVAFAVMYPFVQGVVPETEFRSMIGEAYTSFRHPAVAPLRQLDDRQWLLELFHGPTLAFKDVAMQLLARLMDWALARRGQHATIVGATSGDTGGAAIEAFRSSHHASIFILHPHGRVSEVQRRQMTTVASPSVHNIAIEGTFDDCQTIVKELFNDHRFRDSVRLSGVNSINWARIMPQIVYYVTSALSLGAPDRQIDFTVPTGNFGDIFAGYAAKRMGLPVGRLVIATNVNDILDRTLKTGRYEIRKVIPSTSPSMDIQISSNFERLLFEALERDPEAVRSLMARLNQAGAFDLSAETLRSIGSVFASATSGETESAETIRETLAATGDVLDPHSAVGYAAARRLAGRNPMVTLATAHPAKFPDAVEHAAGIRPDLPHHLSGLMTAPERFKVIPNNPEAVKAHIREQITAAGR